MATGTTKPLLLVIVTVPATPKLPNVTVFVATTVHVELPAFCPAVPVWLAGVTDLSNDQPTVRSNEAFAVVTTSSGINSVFVTSHWTFSPGAGVNDGPSPQEIAPLMKPSTSSSLMVYSTVGSSSVPADGGLLGRRGLGGVLAALAVGVGADREVECPVVAGADDVLRDVDAAELGVGRRACRPWRRPRA